MIGLAKYISLSVLAAVAVVYHGFATRQNFFPSILYLSTSKMAVAVMGNLAFASALCVHSALIKIFLGTLRDIENEMIRERLASATMESLLALTIFREEFSAFFMAMFASLIFIKVLHWLVQDRVDYVEVTPTVSWLQHVRIVGFMGLLLGIDSMFLQYTIAGTIASGGQSVQLLFAFEYVILSSTIIRYFLKYLMSMVDLILEGRWETKGTYVFYLELVTDLLHLCVYLIFFIIVFTNYGLPLHLVRDLYSTFRNFRNRITDFLRFRQVTARLDRFPNASAEDLARSDGVCIICREEMSATGANKRLFCGHVFHLHCLRSWLERQQNCPTCRGSVFRPRRQAEGAAPAAPAAVAAGGAAAAPEAGAPGLFPGQAGDAAAAPAAEPGAAGAAGAEAPAAAAGAGHYHGHLRLHRRHVHVVRAGRARQADGGAAAGEGGVDMDQPPTHGPGPAGANLPPSGWHPAQGPAAAGGLPVLPVGGLGIGADMGQMQLSMLAGLMTPVPLLPLVPSLAGIFPGVTPQPLPGATMMEQQAAAAAVAAAITASSMFSPIGGLIMLPTPLPTAPMAAAASAATVSGEAAQVSLAAALQLVQRQLEVLQGQMESLRQSGAFAAPAAPSTTAEPPATAATTTTTSASPPPSQAASQPTSSATEEAPAAAVPPNPEPTTSSEFTAVAAPSVSSEPQEDKETIHDLAEAADATASEGTSPDPAAAAAPPVPQEDDEHAELRRRRLQRFGQ